MTSSSPSLYVLMFIAGCAVPTMASINAGLGQRLAHPLAAVVVLCAVATAVSALAWIVLTVTPGTDLRAPLWATARPWHVVGGALFVVYILSATYAVPHIGLGNAIFMVLLGQMVTSAAIDHFGWLGAPVHDLSARRALGLVVMAFGVLLARRDSLPVSPGG